jgi:hypothetical protein
MRSARIVAALVLVPVVAAGAGLAVGRLIGLDPAQALGPAAIGLAVTTFQLTNLAWGAARRNAPTVSLQLDGSDDALMRHAAALLRARGVGSVHVDRPARSVLGRRVRIHLEPDDQRPQHWHVTVRAAPLFANRDTDWERYRSLAESTAAEFRTTTAGTTSPPGTR